MNAHSAIDSGSAGGRPQLDKEVLAVQQAVVLQHLAAHPEAELQAMATALDRDASNLRKTLDRLGREGLVTAKPFKLTAQGQDFLPRIAIIQGAPLAEGGLPPLSWSQIRRNPDNPRRPASFIDSEQDALAENIARRGLKQPVLVLLDPDGKGGELDDGERRFEAIGRLIANGDERWPADRPVPYVANASFDAADRLADALVTSIHKKNLHPLEEMAAFARLKELGWTTGQILEETGFERKTYELRMDLRNLNEAQAARMRLDPDDDNYLSVKGARLLLQHLRQIAQPVAGQQTDIESRTLDLTPKLQLALLEAAHAIEQRPDRGRIALTGPPEGGGLATLVERGLLTLEQVGGKYSLGLPKAGAAMAWLNDFHFFDNPTARMATVRTEVLGPTKHAFHIAQRTYATDELNVDPTVYRGHRFPNVHHASEARRIGEGEGGGASAPARPKPPAAEPAKEAAKLKPNEERILVEVAHHIFLMGDDDGGAPVGKYWLDGAVDRLVQDPDFRFIRFGQSATGWRVYLTPAGEAYVEKTIGDAPGSDDLDRVRGASGQAGWPGPGYVTSWLNVEETPPADAAGAQAAAGTPYEGDEADEQDLEEAKAQDVLTAVIAGIREGYGAIDIEGYEGAKGFRALLEATGLQGPFLAGEDGSIAPPRGGSDYAQVDVNGDLPDAMVHARAQVIAFALNAFAGYRPAASEGGE